MLRKAFGCALAVLGAREWSAATSEDCLYCNLNRLLTLVNDQPAAWMLVKASIIIIIA
jgi:hypothetical protein